MFVICPKCGAKYQIPAQVSLKSGQKMQCSACEHYFVYTPYKAKESEKYSSNRTEPMTRESFKMNEPVVSSVAAPVSTMANTPLPEVFQPSFVPEKKSSLLLPILIVIFSFLILLVLVGLAWQYRMELRDQDFLKNLQVSRPSVVEEPIVSPDLETQSEVFEQTPVIAPEQFSSQPEKVFEQKNISHENQDNSFDFRSVRFKLVPHQDKTAVQIEGFVYNPFNRPVVLPRTVIATAYDFQGNPLFEKEIYLQQNTLYPNQELPFFGTYSPAPEEIKWIDISYHD